MMAHTKEQFEVFLSQLKETNATLAFYSDFVKIGRNVADISISLNMLNYLIGKDNLRQAVQDLWNRDPSVFDVMDILIATRKKDKKKFFDENEGFLLIHSLFKSVDGIMKFLEETGLADVFRKREIKNLVDYVFGVETGLDSNARKNRSGDNTEDLIARLFRLKDIEFEEQVSSSVFPEISEALGVDRKIFDFCIKTPKKTYLVEANFYSSGGSKLNEVARSYTDVAPKVNSVSGFEFVWITDGQGWHSAKNKLEEAYMSIPKIYNLTTIREFLNEIM